MPRKRTGYDAACYYDGKLLGRCTRADSEAYCTLMKACGGDAARVLREYAYFSPELRVILEKAALIQSDRNRTGGMFHAPQTSPWGPVQSCDTLCPGVFLVTTASHGGIRDKAAFEENINRSIRQYNPDYWRARQSGIEAAKEARRPRPDREAAR